MDTKIAGLLLYGHLQRGPPICSNSHLEPPPHSPCEFEQGTRRKSPACHTSFDFESVWLPNSMVMEPQAQTKVINQKYGERLPVVMGPRNLGPTFMPKQRQIGLRRGFLLRNFM